MVERVGIGYAKSRCPVFFLLFQSCGPVDRSRRGAGSIERITTKLESEQGKRTYRQIHCQGCRFCLQLKECPPSKRRASIAVQR